MFHSIASEQETEFPVSKGEQQIMIVSGLQQWRPDKNTGSYTVTDLDGNGRLEIISSSVKNNITQTRIWEVNNTGDGLTEYVLPWTEGESQPDIVIQSVPVYYDTAEDIRYFIFEDYITIDEKNTIQNKVVFSLKNESVTSEVLASCSKVYTNETDYTASYTDAQGNEITEEEYINVADIQFSDLEKLEANFNWINVQNHPLESVNLEQVLELVSEAFARFSVNPVE